jgi:hypothetical protein
MSDSRSIAEAGRASGSALRGAGVLSVERHSSFLIVLAWISTSLRSRSISAFMFTPRILPLGRRWLAGIFSGKPRKTGEWKVNLTNYSEANGGAKYN